MGRETDPQENGLLERFPIGISLGTGPLAATRNVDHVLMLSAHPGIVSKRTVRGPGAAPAGTGGVVPQRLHRSGTLVIRIDGHGDSARGRRKPGARPQRLREAGEGLSGV